MGNADYQRWCRVAAATAPKKQQALKRILGELRDVLTS